MSRGLGKFERWVLINTYRKTVQHELPGDWRRTRQYGYTAKAVSLPNVSEEHRRHLQSRLDRYQQCLWVSELMLNYFQLPVSSIQQGIDIEREKFRTTPRYRSALAITSRTLKQLQQKSLIKVRESGLGDLVGLRGVELTPLGKSKAAQLVNANSGDNCPGY